MDHRLTLGVIGVSIALSACTVRQTVEPSLTGPSEFSTSLTMTANPDTVVLNGQQSNIVVEAHDATGAPLANLHVHLELLGAASSCGALATSEVFTNGSGRATVVFTAPSLPLSVACSGVGSFVSIGSFAVGTNAQATPLTTVSLNLLEPALGFTVNFTVTPSSPKAKADVTFSSSGTMSPGHAIAMYQWTFSDGTVKTGSTVTHDFATAGTYLVTLTVTDDIGQSGSKSALITVQQ
jgi:large repetitive protein